MKNIFKLIKLLFSSKLYVIYAVNKNGEQIKKLSSKNIDETFLHYIYDDSRQSLINNVGLQKYGEKLESYEPDLFNAYKEADYQIAKSEYLLAELDYYKLVNNPMSGDANTLFVNYQRLQLLKKQYENFK